ncbi:hypothetical protein DRO69_05090 [Candidatus Bathyarchaeota archaeon]|nr:MAG: hypothetical protein DRO69_05090 [Candidatus Bathyarchaeota archaeon]
MKAQKLFSITLSVLGIGYVLVNLAVLILLGYYLSQRSISSLEAVTQIGGMTLFIIASILLMAVGGLLIVGGIQHYRGNTTHRVILMGVLFTSFYVLCLGIGSALLLSQSDIGAVLLIVSPVLMMVGAAAYVTPSSLFKIIGSIVGIAGAIPLAIGIFTLQPLSLVFTDWDVLFPGPFMSMAFLEGVAVILGAVAVFTHSLLSERKERSVSQTLLSLVGIVYGIDVFIGPLVLSFSLTNLLWKAPWLPPLNGAPYYVYGTTILWSVSLLILAIGGILLTLSSFLEFMFATKNMTKLKLQ